MSLPFVSFVTAPLLARSLGDEGRGDYASLSGPLLLIGVLGTIGLQDALTSALASGRIVLPASIDILRRWIPALIVFNVLLVVGFSVLVGLGGGSVGAAAVFFVISGPAAMAAGLLHGIAVGAGWLSVVNLNRVVNAVGRAIVLPVAFLLGVLDLRIALAALAGSQVLATCAMAAQLRRRMRANTVPRSPYLRSGATISWREALAYLIGSTCAVGLARLDISVALPLVGSAALGIYAVAVSLIDVSTALTQAIRTHVLSSSTFVVMSARRCWATSATCACVGLLLAVVGWMCSPFIIPLLFGDQFRDVVGVLRILLISLPPSFGISATAAFLVRMGMPRAQTLVYGCSLIVDVAAMLLLAHFGAVGLAIAMTAACWVGFLVSIGLVYKGCGSSIGAPVARQVP